MYKIHLCTPSVDLWVMLTVDVTVAKLNVGIMTSDEYVTTNCNNQI